MSVPGSCGRLQDPLPAEGLEALCAAIAPGAHVTEMRALQGGIQGSVHEIVLRRSIRKVQRVVLKRYSAEFLARAPGAFDAERRGLEMAHAAGAAVPRVLWVDRAGSVFGDPALAMTHLPGISLTRAMSTFEPGDNRWITEIARVLARIHTTPPVPGDRDILPRGDVDAVWQAVEGTLAGAEREERLAALPHGETVAAILTERWHDQISQPITLLHGDFHPSNLLWQEGNLSGVLDWAEARIGAREYDLAHARWELALRHGPDAAERFLQAYESASGYRAKAIGLWDLKWIWFQAEGIRSWVWFHELEGQSVSLEALIRQRDRWLEHVLMRVEGP